MGGDGMWDVVTKQLSQNHDLKLNLDDDNLQNFGILFITTNEMIRQKKTTEIFCKIISIWMTDK